MPGFGTRRVTILVVGTEARILYQDEEGRCRIALKFNELVRRGEIGP
jgi:urocanate hydratase